MTKLFLTGALALLLSSCAGVQTSWSGHATQDGGGLSNHYPMTLDMKQSGSRVSGTSFFSVPNKPDVFCRYAFKGTRQGDSLFITEYKILQATDFGGTWLKKDVRLKITGKDGERQWLTGTWSTTQASATGEIKLDNVKTGVKK